MNKIYTLESDVTDFCSFIQDYPEGERSIIGRAMQQNWKPFADSYNAISLELRKNDSGKKNYQFDLSSALSPFFVISELTIEKIGDILLPRGQVLPVETQSKKKLFWGYYPTNVLSGCFDRENSLFREAERGLIVEKPVLKADNITDEYLFSIEEDISRVFVTDAFKRRVEEAGLLGFDFSVEIPTT
ncbi:hypothetical protein V6307_11045 [Serratia marcescens]|uniref:hypothetical protein n=1 Tax=Serratia marcescens TaxID=615 RepID=UPI0036F89E12|nr:hypothetical protein [Klebsiella aerogenes]